MNKDLYIEFLENEIRRIRAGANTHYGQSIGWMDEMEDLKLENDRLQKQNDLLIPFVKSASCDGCSDCVFKTSNPRGPKCAYLRGPDGPSIIKGKARIILKKLEEL